MIALSVLILTYDWHKDLEGTAASYASAVIPPVRDLRVVDHGMTSPPLTPEQQLEISQVLHDYSRKISRDFFEKKISAKFSLQDSAKGVQKGGKGAQGAKGHSVSRVSSTNSKENYLDVRFDCVALNLDVRFAVE
jgi:hypothetical protein